jgi:hypothetical protein
VSPSVSLAVGSERITTGNSNPFALWDRHELNTFGVLLEQRRFVGLACFGFLLKILDKRSERGRSRRLKPAREVDQAIYVGEDALAARTQREAGMSACPFKKIIDRRSYGAVVAPLVQSRMASNA